MFCPIFFFTSLKVFFIFSTYAHYYDDEEDGWDMPNFYNEGYMKDGLAGKMNSLARSNASLYGNKEELYDRLRRHAYQGGKKGSWIKIS